MNCLLIGFSVFGPSPFPSYLPNISSYSLNIQIIYYSSPLVFLWLLFAYRIKSTLLGMVFKIHHPLQPRLFLPSSMILLSICRPSARPHVSCCFIYLCCRSSLAQCRQCFLNLKYTILCFHSISLFGEVHHALYSLIVHSILFYVYVLYIFCFVVISICF